MRWSFLLLFSTITSIGYAQDPGLEKRLSDVRAFNHSLSAASADAAIPDQLERRRRALTSIIQSHPKLALNLMLDVEQLQRLRALPGVDPEALESVDTVRGMATVIVADEVDEGRAITMIEIGSGAAKVTAYLEDTSGAAPRSNDVLRVSGYRLGATMAATNVVVEQSTTASACSLAGVQPVGVQKVAVLLVKPPGVPTPALTTAQVESAFFGTTGSTVNNFYIENSYNQTSLTGNAFGWFTLDQYYGSQQLTPTVAAAIAAADSTVDLRNYQRIVVLQAADSSAIANIGCVTLHSPLYGDFVASSSVVGLLGPDIPALTIAKRTTNHEMGHNFELQHSRSLKFNDRSLGPDRLQAESDLYGDKFSTMGSSMGHFAAAMKVQLGWLPAASVQSVTTSGIYTVAPLESAALATRTLKIKRNLNTDEWLWLEYRQNTGTVDSLFDASLASVYSGALIHYQDAATGDFTDLLDMVPPFEFQNAALPNGSTWIDPHSNLRIQVVQATPTGLTVNVTYDNLCASYNPPATTFSSAAQQFSVTVNASSTCSWTATGNNYWVSAAPASGNGNGSVTVSLDQNTSSKARSGSITIGRQTSFFQQSGVAQSPIIVLASPNQGTIPTGTMPAALYLRDMNGYEDLSELHFQFGTTQATANSCYLKYDFAANRVYLMNDAGTGFQAATMVPGDPGRLSNSQCEVGTILASNYNENDFRFSFFLWFKQPTPPSVNFYAMLQDKTGLSTGWTNQGTLTLSSASCIQKIIPADLIAGAQSGTSTTGVVTDSGCSWTATSDSLWLHSMTSSGTGTQSVTVQYDAFSGTGSRTGRIQFGTGYFTVVQFATANVEVSLIPVETRFLASGGPGSVRVSVLRPADFNWSVVNNAPTWITVTSATNFTGYGYVYFNVAANPGAARQSSLTVADGRVFVIRQAALDAPDLVISKSHTGNFIQGQSGHQYTLTVYNSGTAPTSGTVTVTDTLPTGLTAAVIAGSGWTCTAPSGPCTRSDVLTPGASYPPITLVVNVSSSAPASVLNLATVSGGGDGNSSNNSTSDVTTIVSGTLCTYTVSPTSITLPAAGGNHSVAVTAQPSTCAISVVKSDTWMSAVNIFGNWIISAPATTVARSGTVSFSGKTVTVTQLGPQSCGYTIPAGPHAFAASGGNGSLPIASTQFTQGCTWQASTNATWIMFTTMPFGSGASATLTFTIAPNQSCAARSATISLGNGVQATITQPFTPPNLGVFRNGTWYFDSNHNGVLDAFDATTGLFGTTGDYPFYEHWSWDSSPQAKQAIFQNTTNRWLFDFDGSGTVTPGDGNAIEFKAGASLPVVGDWTSTGGTRIGSFFANSGEWYLDKSGDAFYSDTLTDFYLTGFGQSGDQPVAGNWNNSSAGVRIGVFRPSLGQWLLRQNALASSTATTSTTIPNFGASGDIAITGDWNGDGNAKIGVFRNGTWYLDCKNDHVFANALTYQFGAAGDRPFLANAPQCSNSFKPGSSSIASQGDIRNFRVITSAGCSWTAASSVSWITILSGSSGTGPAIVRYRVDPFSGGNEQFSRTGAIVVAGRSFIVRQAAPGHVFKLSSQSSTNTAAGGDFTIAMDTSAGPDWVPASSADWISAMRNDEGNLAVHLDPNTGASPRTGSIAVGGQVLQILQRSANPASPFGDVATGHLFFDYIWLLKDNAVTSGCTSSTYCPDATTTRGQMAVFIIRSMLGDSFTYPQAPSFTDVASTHPFFAYIQKMMELGITTGCTATAYCPDDAVTRGQMAAFLIRARLGIPGGGTFPFDASVNFSDVATTHPFYSFVQKMRELGITTGCSATSYCPDDPATRGQMAVFLIRSFFTP